MLEDGNEEDLRPEQRDSEPAAEAMERFKGIVRFEAEAGDGEEADQAEQEDECVGECHDGDAAELVGGILLGQEDGVEDEPGGRGGRAPAVHAAEVVEFGDHSTEAEGYPVRGPAEDGVEAIDDEFLSHEDRCADVCCSRCRHICQRGAEWGGIAALDEDDNQGYRVTKNDYGKEALIRVQDIVPHPPPPWLEALAGKL